MKKVMNAVLIGKFKDKYNAYRTDLLYEYRGKTYLITAYNNGYSESLRDQHKREQARIDRELLENQKPIQPYTGEADKALEQFFEYLDTGVWKD